MSRMSFGVWAVVITTLAGAFARRSKEAYSCGDDDSYTRTRGVVPYASAYVSAIMRLLAWPGTVLHWIV